MTSSSFLIFHIKQYQVEQNIAQNNICKEFICTLKNRDKNENEVN